VKNALKPLKLAAGVLVVMASIGVASISAHAQSSDAAAAPTAKSSKASNKALSKEVRRAMTKTKGLTSSNINVRVRDGAVTLAGTVPDNSQIEKATEAAKSVPGVTSVKNAITIREVGR
jgi:osmotically-inducible protein OsmY